MSEALRNIPFRRTMGPRDSAETHRGATPLELLFDLIFVVAVASAGTQLHTGLTEGRLGTLLGYVFVFMAIWWAWMGFTWFASAYDCDDVIYRLLAFVIMSGSLVLAAGVPDLFADGQSVIAVCGYALMRVGLVGMWLRAAADDPERRRTCLSYALGIVLVQVAWFARLLIDESHWLVVTFFAGMACELAIPYIAERQGPTPFHPGHMAERYGCFTIIVLGEVVLSSVVAVQGALADTSGELIALIVGGLLIVFSTWWLYFKRDHADLFTSNRLLALVPTAYGHFFIFAAVGAVGAALATSVDVVQGVALASPRFAGLFLGCALAVFALVLALMHALGERSITHALPAVIIAAALIAVPFLGLNMGATVLFQGLVLVAGVAGLVAASTRTHAKLDSR